MHEYNFSPNWKRKNSENAKKNLKVEVSLHFHRIIYSLSLNQVIYFSFRRCAIIILWGTKLISVTTPTHFMHYQNGLLSHRTNRRKCWMLLKRVSSSQLGGDFKPKTTLFSCVWLLKMTMMFAIVLSVRHAKQSISQGANVA